MGASVLCDVPFVLGVDAGTAAAGRDVALSRVRQVAAAAGVDFGWLADVLGDAGFADLVAGIQVVDPDELQEQVDTVLDDVTTRAAAALMAWVAAGDCGFERRRMRLRVLLVED